MAGVTYSGQTLESTYARFHLNIPTICYDIEVQTVRYTGSPDLYAATAVEPNPGIGAYGTGLRTLYDNKLHMSVGQPVHPAGDYHLAVYCERGMPCNPTQFTVRVR